MKEGDAPKKEEEKKPDQSMQSGVSMTMTETSEDARERAEAEAAKAKKKDRGLTEKEMAAHIDIELYESETITLFMVPGITGVMETEEFNIIDEENKKYETLLDNKKGSDSYEGRGTQTMNYTLKSREINCTDLHTFIEHPVFVQASNYDIDDASKQENVGEAQKMTNGFYESIARTMTERMKDPRCLIDAEALASHVSIVSLSESKPPGTSAQTGTKTRKNKAGGSKSGATGEQSSASQLKESQS